MENIMPMNKSRLRQIIQEEMQRYASDQQIASAYNDFTVDEINVKRIFANDNRFDFSMWISFGPHDISDVPEDKYYIGTFKYDPAGNIQEFNPHDWLPRDMQTKIIDILEQYMEDTINNNNTIHEEIENQTVLFTLEEAPRITEQLQTLPVPWIKTIIDTLGGKERPRIILKLSFDPKEEWSHGIFQNSKHTLISIRNNGVVANFSGSAPRLRKFTAKSINNLMQKLNQYIKKVKEIIDA